jgi:hypothetical protein
MCCSHILCFHHAFKGKTSYLVSTAGTSVLWTLWNESFSPHSRNSWNKQVINLFWLGGSNGVWIQGLELARQTFYYLNYVPSLDQFVF